VKVLGETVEMVRVGDLKPHPRNPRKGNVGAIRESIEANGFYGAVVAQRSTSHVLAGNHRLLAAREAGADALPVIWVDVADDVALRILLADNRTNDLATYDTTALTELLQDIIAEVGDLAGTGYDKDALDALVAEVAPGADSDLAALVDKAAELAEKWGTKRGQVWTIPSKNAKHKTHRLMCGDSTNAGDVARLLGGEEPNLMVTDPPYGVEYDPEWRRDAGVNKNEGKMGKVQNDERADWTEAWDLFPGNVAYVWHAGVRTSEVLASLSRSKFEARSQIVWRKDRFALSRGHYHWQHEPCWYVVRKGGGASWAGDRSQSTVWDIPSRDDSGSGHGTQKPLECMARPIRNHKGDVYDPFVGSGTTILAAESLGRACFAMEIDPSYLGVVLERLHGSGLAPQMEPEAEDAAED